MNILVWIIFGLIAGAAANILDPSPSKSGIVGAVVLGVAGALLGGFLANIIFGLSITGFNLTSFVIAILGSLLLLFLGRAVRGT